MPSFSSVRTLSTCCFLVSGFFTERVQHIHSLRARGVRFSHTASASASEARVFRKSSGNSWATPPEISLLVIRLCSYTIALSRKDGRSARLQFASLLPCRMYKDDVQIFACGAAGSEALGCAAQGSGQAAREDGRNSLARIYSVDEDDGAPTRLQTRSRRLEDTAGEWGRVPPRTAVSAASLGEPEGWQGVKTCLAWLSLAQHWRQATRGRRGTPAVREDTSRRKASPHTSPAGSASRRYGGIGAVDGWLSGSAGRRGPAGSRRYVTSRWDARATSALATSSPCR